jgi:competence protein ComEC
VPVAAQAVCAPVILVLSPAVPTYAVLANVVAAPAVGPATIGGLLAALLGLVWPTGASWCAHVAGAACWWIASVARTATGLPGAQVAWAGGVVGQVLLGCACAAALVLVLQCRRGMAP